MARSIWPFLWILSRWRCIIHSICTKAKHRRCDKTITSHTHEELWMRIWIRKENQFEKIQHLREQERKWCISCYKYSFHLTQTPSLHSLRFDVIISLVVCALIPFTMRMNKRLQLLQMFNNESDPLVHAHTHSTWRRHMFYCLSTRQWYTRTHTQKSFTF